MRLSDSYSFISEAEMYRCFLKYLLFMILIVQTAVQAAAQQTQGDTVYTIIGTSAVWSGNVSAARERAIKNSLVSALERAVSERLSQDTLVGNFQILNDLLFNDVDAHILGYRVLTEARSKAYYRVVVEATVAVEKIEDKLSMAGMFLSRNQLPKLLVLMVEQLPDGEMPAYLWGEDIGMESTRAGKTLIEQLRQDKYTVIGPEGRIESIRYTAIAMSPEVDILTATQFAGRLGADVVVIGKSFTELTPNIIGETIRSYRATVWAIAVRADTGETLVKTEVSAVAVNEDELSGVMDALSQAGVKAGSSLAEQISLAWRSETGIVSEIEIFIKGTAQLANFIRLRRAISEVQGVTDIRIREMRPNEAMLVVKYEGTPQRLAEDLMLNTFDNFGIHIKELGETNIHMALTVGEVP